LILVFILFFILLFVSPYSFAAEPMAPTVLEAKPCVPLPGKAPEMVVIAAGRFFMGSVEGDGQRDERPQHGVAVVQPFAMSRCEVTVAEFRAFVLETAYKTDAELGKGCYVLNEAKDGFEQKRESDWTNPGFEQAENHPVVCVSWRDARAYAYWLSLKTGQKYRLPTEVEWEYAARAGTETVYWWGDEASHEYANYGDEDWVGAVEGRDEWMKTAPVGRFPRNAFGLSDMLGNVWEWTADCWHGGYSDAPYDGSAWLEGAGAECDRRVIRGGSWIHVAENMRSASRFRITTGVPYYYIGFRLARALF